MDSPSLTKHSNNPLHRFTRWNRMGILTMRVFKLLNRYGLTESRFKRNFQLYTRILSRHQSRATFPTTAVTLGRHPQIMHWLCDNGVELALHGYTHIDYSQLDFDRQNQAIAQGIETFKQIGLAPTGMRSPYLWWNEATRKATLANGLKYCSNQVHIWDTYDTPEIRSLYHIKQKPPDRSLPKLHDGLVEIPISLPDDFILSERIGLSSARVAEIWTHILEAAAERNEMLTLQLHPELIFPCAEGLDALLTKARTDPDRFWCACLDEVATWWLARQKADVLDTPTAGGYNLTFQGAEEAVWLLKPASDPESEGTAPDYHPIEGRTLKISGKVRPFVAVSASAPRQAVIELKEEGYIVRRGVDSPDEYAVYLDDAVLENGTLEDWVGTVSSTGAAIVKCARWPGNRRAALVITGDLDCVTLFDYAWRLAGK